MLLCQNSRKKDNHIYRYLSWTKEGSKNAIVIAHGMAEHPARYDHFAQYLNMHGYDVYGIFEEGHGEINKDNLGHFDKNGFYDCVDNLDDLILSIKNKYGKVILFGHSMGSFVSQEYLSTYSKNIDACILCGSSSPDFIVKMGSFLSKTIYLFADKKKPARFMNNLSFGSYNKQFKPARSEFDWLTRDEKVVDQYIEDPYCGYICTVGFYQSFLSGFAKLHKKNKLKNIRKDIPIFIIGGSKDPVSNNGEGLRTLLVRYKENNISDVTLKIYDKCRHEILNELNKEEVYNDIKEWLGSRLDEKDQ